MYLGHCFELEVLGWSLKLLETKKLPSANIGQDTALVVGQICKYLSN